MDLRYTAAEMAFREEVRAFAQAAVPPEIRAKVFAHQHTSKEDYVRWHRILFDKGWGAPNWPKIFGGTGWNAIELLIFEVECFRAGAPRLIPFGLAMIGPVLMKYGSSELQSRFLPRIPPMQDWWCQGYSEPGAGSDLASLKTSAVRKGNHYLVNGMKTWNTLGQFADWMFCLVRTNPTSKPQEGISMLLIDMASKGVSRRPIAILDGAPEIIEVWLDNVEVPVENLVGKENEGWTYAKFLLSHERTSIAGIGHCHRELQNLKRCAAAAPHNGKSMLEEPRMRDKIARIEMEIMALEMLLLRVADESAATGPGPQSSILKIRGSELQQDLAMLQMEVAGPRAWPYDVRLLDAASVTTQDVWPTAATSEYLNLRKTTIYGGSNEIQKNVISKMILGF